MLKPEELRLYRLIWQRALASQMAPKELETTTVDLADGPYELRATSTRTLFEGFARVYTEGRDDDAAEEDENARRLPTLAEGDRTDVRDVTPTQHFTEPPPRFTEATLIKALEEHGIGRPSTYAATISTIIDRGYVRVEERRLHPEPVAGIVTDLLVEHFGDYVDLAFTARMEEELDEIARGERAWVPLLEAFYAPLRDRVAEKRRELRRSDFTTEATDEVCSRGPSDGHPPRAQRSVPGVLDVPGAQGDAAAPRGGATAPGGHRRGLPEVRRGDPRRSARPFGPFLGCSRYPDCDYIKREGPPPPEPLPVRGHLPEEQRRPPRPASRATDRERLLGVLELSEVRFHDEQRAARRAARRRRRTAGAQGRGGDLPEVRLDQRRARPTPSCPARPIRAGRPIPRRLLRPARRRRRAAQRWAATRSVAAVAANGTRRSTEPAPEA